MIDLTEAIARIKQNSGYNRDTQWMRDIRAVVEALENVKYEYGTRWHVEGDADNYWPELREAHTLEYAEDSLEEALDIIEMDRVAMKLEEPRGILIRRPVFDSPWEEVK